MHNRLNERETLQRKLEAGINIHMPAPRRIGKTWTINRLAEDLRGKGWVVIEEDVQGVSSPDRFARNLCRRTLSQLSPKASIWAALKGRITSLIGGEWGPNLWDAIGRVDPMDFLEELIKALADEGGRTAIFIDEIAFFALRLAEENPEEAYDFFYQMRRLQLEHKTVRWLYTGSIGLNIVADRFGFAGAFSDFDTFVLEPFSPEQARSFLRDDTIQVAFNHRFVASDEDLDHVFEELGWLAPYYLKLVANEVQPSGRAVDGVLTATRSDFETAFEKLLEPNRNLDFAVWADHVDKNLPKSEQETARNVLDKLSCAADGEIIDTLLASLIPITERSLKNALDILVNDGLLQKVDARYRFRSGLIRRYWKEYEAS